MRFAFYPYSTAGGTCEKKAEMSEQDGEFIMSQEKRKMSKRKKVVLSIAGIFVLAATIGIGVFYCTFFPNPLAKSISTGRISSGTTQIRGESNILVAYFSLTNNRAYHSEEIDAVSSASLKIRDEDGYGHAELLAIAAREATGGDLFAIQVTGPYGESYGEAFNRHREESDQKTLPELTSHLDSIDGYDTVVLIYPNWMSSAPQPVLSFLNEYDFMGKTIIPIATSQMLGLGGSPEQIRVACPDAVIAEGLSSNSETEVQDFLKETIPKK